MINTTFELGKAVVELYQVTPCPLYMVNIDDAPYRASRAALRPPIPALTPLREDDGAAAGLARDLEAKR